MRFSLRTLLLMFPAIVIAFGIALLNTLNTSQTEAPIDTGISNELANVQMHVTWIESQIKTRKAIPNIQHINQLLLLTNNFSGDSQGSLPWVHPCGHRDGWGHLYVAIALDENNRPLPTAIVSQRVGFYSLGQDGKSDSHGNDPDDLNSWNSSPNYYQVQAESQRRNELRVKAFWNMPVPLALLTGLVFFWRDRHLAAEEGKP